MGARPDQGAAAVLVPLLSLGRRAIATEGGGARSGTFSFALAAVPAGGPELQPAHLSSDLFEAAAMRVVDKDLMAMKVAELKEELEVRWCGASARRATRPGSAGGCMRPLCVSICVESK